MPSEYYNWIIWEIWKCQLENCQWHHLGRIQVKVAGSWDIIGEYYLELLPLTPYCKCQIRVWVWVLQLLRTILSRLSPMFQRLHWQNLRTDGRLGRLRITFNWSSSLSCSYKVDRQQMTPLLSVCILLLERSNMFQLKCAQLEGASKTTCHTSSKLLFCQCLYSQDPIPWVNLECLLRNTI